MTRVYVLGAGAGAAYKGSYLGETSPVAKNFFQKAMRVINIHQIRGRSYNDENMDFAHIFQFIERLWGIARHEVGTSSLDMEEVLTLLNIEMEEDQPGRERLLQAYEEYLLLMALTFDKILYGDLCPYHSKIAASLNPGDTIISFNYELLMDYALLRANSPQKLWCIQDGYGISCRYLSGSIASPYLKPQADSGLANCAKVKLLKLHGSLNWLYCPQCGQLYAYEHSDGGGHSVLINGIANMIQCTSQHCCNKLSRVIIPPTLMKNYQSIPFIPELWHQARRALGHASEIVVIGYSFPTTDFRSNWMFRKAMVDNKGLKKVTIVDKAAGYQLKTLLDKHKSIFRVKDVDFYPDIGSFTQTLNTH